MKIKKTDKGETEVFYATTDKFTKKDFIERANAFRKANDRKVKYVLVFRKVSNNFNFEKTILDRSVPGGGWYQICMNKSNFGDFLDCCSEWQDRGFDVYIRVTPFGYSAIVWMDNKDDDWRK